jgi:uncharacterized protein YndB with AHSA1/START domain
MTTAAATEVWQTLANPYSYASWVSGTAAIRQADASWPAVGARLYHRFGPWPLRFRDRTTVLDCEPPTRLVLEAAAWPWGVARAEITVTTSGSGARIDLAEELVSGPGAWWPAAGRLVQRRRNARSLAQLVELVEQRAG